MTHADLPEGFVWLCLGGGLLGGLITILLMSYGTRK
jgi:hypothetical protein